MMRAQHDRDLMFRGERFEQIPHFTHNGRVETRGGLIEQQQPRIVDKGADQMEFAAHAAREGFKPMIRAILQTKTVQQRAAAGPHDRAVQAVQRAVIFKLLGQREIFVIAGVFGNQSDARAHGIGCFAHAKPININRSGCGREQAADDANGCGFSRPLGPNRPKISPGAMVSERSSTAKAPVLEG